METPQTCFRSAGSTAISQLSLLETKSRRTWLAQLLHKFWWIPHHAVWKKGLACATHKMPFWSPPSGEWPRVVCNRGDSDLWNGVAFCVHVKPPKKTTPVGFIVLTQHPKECSINCSLLEMSVLWGFDNMESAKECLCLWVFRGNSEHFYSKSSYSFIWVCDKVNMVRGRQENTKRSEVSSSQWSSSSVRKTSQWRFCRGESYMDHFHHCSQQSSTLSASTDSHFCIFLLAQHYHKPESSLKL